LAIAGVPLQIGFCGNIMYNIHNHIVENGENPDENANMIVNYAQ
jgi:hypothetical protein